MKHVFLASVRRYNAEMKTTDLKTKLFVNLNDAKAYLRCEFLCINSEYGNDLGEYEYFDGYGFLVKEQPDVEGFTSDDWCCIGKIELKEVN